MPKKAYINFFDNAHKYLRSEVMPPERVSTQYVILGYVAELVDSVKLNWKFNKKWLNVSERKSNNRTSKKWTVSHADIKSCHILFKIKIISWRRCQSRVKRTVDKTRKVNNDNKISSPKATAINYLILPYYHLVGGREQHIEILILKQFIMSKVFGQNQGCQPLNGWVALGFNRKKGLALFIPHFIWLKCGNNAIMQKFKKIIYGWRFKRKIESWKWWIVCKT